MKESLPNWLYEVEWCPQMHLRQQLTPDKVCTHSWLILADRQGMGQQLATLLQAQGETCILVFQGKEYKQLAEAEFKIDPASPVDFQLLLMQTVGKGKPPLRGVVHLWSLDVARAEAPKVDDLEAAFQKGCGSTLHLVQSLLKVKLDEPYSLWLVTQGSQSVGIQPTVSGMSQAPLWGMGKAITLEYPELNCVLVDLDPGVQESQAQDLFEEVWLEVSENQVAFRDQVRYAATLVHSRELQVSSSHDKLETVISHPEGMIESGNEEPILFRKDGTYLIIGGLGDLGLQVARWMVERGALHVVLLERSSPDSDLNQQLMELERAGIQVVIAQADESQSKQIAQVMAEIEQSLPPLRGLIHCMDVLDDDVLPQQTWKRFSQAIMPALESSWHLHDLTKNIHLDFFVLFSSIASLLGRSGQASQAAATAFLDALAYWRRALGLPGLSINWEDWTTIKTASQRHDSDLLKEKDVKAIAPQQGLQILEQLLFCNSAQIAVMPSPFIPELAHGAQKQFKDQQQTEQLNLLEQLQEASPSERQGHLVVYVREQVAKVLGLDAHSALSLDIKQPLNGAGLGSLMFIELRELFSSDIKIDIPPEKLFQNPSITELAQELAQHLAAKNCQPLDLSASR